MTKVLFMRADGICAAEKINPFKRVIGMQDGWHPVSPKCILTDNDRRLPSLLVIWQGVPGPEGFMFSTPEGETIKNECDLVRQNRHKLMVSRRWVRRLINGLIIFGKFMLLSTMLMFLGLVVWAFLKVVS
jgi:hypothetical protein